MIEQTYNMVRWKRTNKLTRRHIVVPTYDNDEQQTACGIRYRFSDVRWAESVPIKDGMCRNCRRAVESTPEGES